MATTGSNVLGLGPLAAYMSSRQMNGPGIPAAPAAFSASAPGIGADMLGSFLSGNSATGGGVPPFPGSTTGVPGAAGGFGSFSPAGYGLFAGGSPVFTGAIPGQGYGLRSERSFSSGTVAPTGSEGGAATGPGGVPGQTIPAPFDVNGQNFSAVGRTPSYGTLPAGVTAPDFGKIQSGFGPGGGQPTRYNPWASSYSTPWAKQETPAMTSDYMVRNSINNQVKNDLGLPSDGPLFYPSNQSNTVRQGNVRAWDMYNQRMTDAGLGGMVGPEPQWVTDARQQFFGGNSTLPGATSGGGTSGTSGGGLGGQMAPSNYQQPGTSGQITASTLANFLGLGR